MEGAQPLGATWMRRKHQGHAKSGPLSSIDVAGMASETGAHGATMLGKGERDGAGTEQRFAGGSQRSSVVSTGRGLIVQLCQRPVNEALERRINAARVRLDRVWQRRIRGIAEESRPVGSHRPDSFEC